LADKHVAVLVNWKHCNTARQTLSLSYGRCIAEFLNEGSLVRLGLLDLSTCVGLRYGRLCLLHSKTFLVSLGHSDSAITAVSLVLRPEGLDT
jgi:hypothetical protein